PSCLIIISSTATSTAVLTPTGGTSIASTTASTTRGIRSITIRGTTTPITTTASALASRSAGVGRTTTTILHTTRRIGIAGIVIDTTRATTTCTLLITADGDTTIRTRFAEGAIIGLLAARRSAEAG